MPRRRFAAGALLLAAALLAVTVTGDGGAHAQEGRARGDAAESGDSGAAGASMAAVAVHRETLGNGLRVVLSPDRSVPTVGIAVYYDVGSRQEERGRSGFAHLFEHMMFQGSDNVAKGEHFSLIMNRGGSMNGTTSHDRTNYFETLPANELALGLWLEADRMRSLAITQENFENQRIVVIQERLQSYDNRPYAPSFLRINELAYGDYWPYSHSTIGDMRDLEAAPLSAVQEFWTRWYPPNNAVLVVSGDFEIDAAMALIHQHFDDIERREVPAWSEGDLAPQTAERTDTLYDSHAHLPAFHVTWHIPRSREPDHYALELLAMALGDGESSRLYQELVKEREICTEFFVSTDDRRGPDLFSAFAVMAEGHAGPEARPVIYAAIEDIARRGLSVRELARIRNRIRSYFVFSIQGNLSRARTLAEYELYHGNAELIRTELDRYLAVTSADIQRVASTYFAETNRTVLDVVPQPTPAAEEAQ